MLNEKDYTSINDRQRASFLKEWKSSAEYHRRLLSDLDSKAAKLREEGKTLPDSLTESMADARTLYSIAVRQISRINEANSLNRKPKKEPKKRSK